MKKFEISGDKMKAIYADIFKVMDKYQIEAIDAASLLTYIANNIAATIKELNKSTPSIDENIQ